MAVAPQGLTTRSVRARQASGTVIRCSLTDLMMADIGVSVVFCYPRSLDTARLADGLSAALDRLPAFAGRLRTRAHRLEIVCDNGGVPLSEADAAESLADAIGRVTLPGSGLVEHVDATAARAGGLPLLTVRVSHLADGATALGCSWHHAVGDLQSFLVLMRTWSALADGREPPAALTVPDRDAYLDQVLPARDQGRPGIRLLDPDEAAGLGREVGSAMLAGRTAQIYFSDTEAAQLRDRLSQAAGTRLSRNDALCAHVVAAIRQLDDDPEPRKLAVAVDIRRRLSLDPGVLGNLTNEIYLTCPPRARADQVAAQIRAAVAQFTSEHLSIRSSRAFLDAIGPARVRECVPVGFDLGHKTFTFNSWSRFGLYDIAFDGQRPVFFSPSLPVTLPWTSWLVEGFGGSGFLFTVGVPARLAARLRSPDGRAALHPNRLPPDEHAPPPLAPRRLL